MPEQLNISSFLTKCAAVVCVVHTWGWAQQHSAPTGGVANEPVSTTVEGSVRDADSGLPIGARVKIVQSGSRKTTEVDAATDGSFRVVLKEPGMYLLSAELDGYRSRAFVDSPPVTVKVAEGLRSAKVDLTLYKAATLSGRVIERASLSAVSGLRVKALFARYRRGHLTLEPVSEGITDVTGAFRMSPLAPGDYVIEISSGVAEAILPVRQPDYSKAQPRPLAYRRTFWQGQVEPDQLSTLRVSSGAEVDVGDVIVEREPLFRVRGALLPDECSPGDQLQVNLTQRFGGLTIIRARATLPSCSRPFTIANLAPGRYRLAAWYRDRQPGQRKFSEMQIDVVDSDLEETLQPITPHTLSGRVHFPEGYSASLKARLRVSLRPSGTLPFPDEAKSVELEKDGRFTLLLFDRKEYELTVTGVEAPYCVKDLVYNTTRLSGSAFAPDRYAPEHKLEISLSDAAASITGRVTLGDDPAPGIRALIIPWPVTFMDGYPAHLIATTDEMGQFSRSGLRPGKYRIITLTDAANLRLQRTSEILGALSAGKEVELGERSAVSLDLKVLLHH